MSAAGDRPKRAGLRGAAVLPAADPKPAARPTARKAAGGRFAELNGFIDFTLSGLTPSEVKVWLILFRDTKARTGIAQTGQEAIARRAGITDRGVRKALTGLVRKGLLKVVLRGRIGAGASAYKVRGVNPAGPF